MMKMHISTILIDKTRGLKFTESPRWHDGKLWFLDLHDKRIKTVDYLPEGCGTRRALDFETRR
jgi:hypothetical protein